MISAMLALLFELDGLLRNILGRWFFLWGGSADACLFPANQSGGLYTSSINKRVRVSYKERSYVGCSSKYSSANLYVRSFMSTLINFQTKL